MSFAWEVTDDDIAVVLKRHGVCDPGTADRARELCRDVEADRIEKAVLAYNDFDEQVSSALDEIENILFEEGIVATPKRFAM
jgi:hypothetical protein